VRVAFYGGLGEIGANMASVEVDGRIALIDVGLIFPDAEHHGIDLILPDWASLRDRAGDLHCAVITHAHWDHAQNFDLFPNAPLLRHEHELRYARKPHRNDWATPRWTAAMLEFEASVQTKPQQDLFASAPTPSLRVRRLPLQWQPPTADAPPMSVEEEETC
jgi:mRNA degradation ribonuclease J1/J2